MHRMASRSSKATKGGLPKTPSDKTNISSIRSFMIKDDTPRSQGARQQLVKKGKEKGNENKEPQSGDSRETSIREGGTESDLETSGMDENRPTTHALSKGEMEEMLLRLENVIKGDRPTGESPGKRKVRHREDGKEEK